MTKPRSSQAIAKRHGRDFEKKVASLTKGHIHTGLDGDVFFYGADNKLVHIEAKYRTGLQLNRTDELWHFLDQINRYATKNWEPGAEWALAITGGRKAMFPHLTKVGTYFLVPAETYLRLKGIE